MTDSEQGEMQKVDMSEPKLIEWKSFDQMKITGFYYPASKKFSGKRPVLINIHGGPEGQSMASSLGSGNYYTNEMGVALIYPNVRGSSGYRKAYTATDNGFTRRNTGRCGAALRCGGSSQAEVEQDRIMVRMRNDGRFMARVVADEY